MLSELIRKLKNKPKEEYGWFGNYASWEEASASADGYDKKNILDKTKEALLKVKNGEAAYERDSVVFDKKAYPYPLITYLLHSAFRNGAPLNILDFGGSLGSTYFQVKDFLSPQVCSSWNVVEQAHYVECGREYFENDLLHFFHSIEECNAKYTIDLVILSGVTQYLSNPHSFLNELVSFSFKFLIIDRTAFVKETKDRLTIQRVWPSIYEASYPAWFFNEAYFLRHFERYYAVRAEFTSYVEGESIILIDGSPLGYDKGFFLERK
ncbi:methyltransferase, TIGR04325 family [Pararcticibacter amylolyticus]|uniref:Methyltransferase, TIGR04325 family n=2 Tax=Pararcticibacter amylolyticus TaxID=2173175 RepID=A0A2U2PI59_9SPHI|nr:methyltransferase, TIGR04325 family [Pararcticibacter amylolyticus]